MAWSDAARAAALEARRRKAAARAASYSQMPPSKINALLNKYRVKASKAVDKAIKTGQWGSDVKTSDFLKTGSPLARHLRFLNSRKSELEYEVGRRTGGGYSGAFTRVRKTISKRK